MFEHKDYLFSGGAFTALREKVFGMKRAVMTEETEKWLGQLSHVGPIIGPGTQPWIWTVADYIKVPWVRENVEKCASVESLQAMVDCLYNRTDDSVERGERKDYPPKWPKRGQSGFGG